MYRMYLWRSAPDLADLLWLIPILPLIGCVAALLMGLGRLRKQSHWPCIAATILSCALSVFVLVSIAQGQVAFKTYYTWFQIGNVDVGCSLQADALTAIMLVTVTFIGSLIAIYSVGYMHGDPGYPRYFAAISLFIFSMTGLVLAGNFLLLYAFWEGVGLCSYLLIGFWFAKPSAAAAARKAFLVTRLGDVGLLLGIILIWMHLGSVDFNLVFSKSSEGWFLFEQDQAKGPIPFTAMCLLLFCGAVGKSAQFPLHVWLPDAMEGPSPVSALIHAATMVTAGVYLVARCSPLFALAPDAQLVVACIGGFTALLAALIAVTQTDLKRVLAYSTISQLGLMFLALGSGTSQSLLTLAVVAAIFHLFTHAFFKALLFLSAGSVMHAMGNVIDMRRLGGLGRILPVTHWTFLCGALALAGFPLLSGFWSKDEILVSVLNASGEAQTYHVIYLILFVVALGTAGLTAFYTFRAYFLTFWGEERIPHEAGHHAHESPPVMLVPLIVLAVGAVAVGVIVEPFTHWFSGLLTKTPFLNPIQAHSMNLGVMAAGVVVALAGIGMAWWMYVSEPGLAGRCASHLKGLYQLSLNKFHLDELYDIFIVKPLVGFAQFCRIMDQYVLDGLVDLLGHVPRLVGLVFRPIQNGLVQFYALAMVLGLAVFLIALLMSRVP